MGQRIIFTRADGGITIKCPVGSLSIQELIEKEVPKDATNVSVVDESEIPPSREHRNEWEIKSGKIEINQQKAQAKLDKIAAKEAKKNAVLSKLKISKEELDDLLK